MLPHRRDATLAVALSRLPFLVTTVVHVCDGCANVRGCVDASVLDVSTNSLFGPLPPALDDLPLAPYVLASHSLPSQSCTRVDVWSVYVAVAVCA